MPKKTNVYLILALFFSLLLHGLTVEAQTLRKRTVTLMGGRFDITIVAENANEAERHIDTIITEITRIENLISDWKADSQVSLVNDNAGIRPVKVDREVFELTVRAIQLSQITNGAFDISFAAMERIWKFDGSMTSMPDSAAIKKSVEKVGYKNIILDSAASTIFLQLKGMKIGFGALGEGYAADKCRDMMINKEIKSGIINASGDISSWGKQPNGKNWLIGITNPKQTNELLTTVSLQQGAVTTSGSYEKFAEINGIRYSHIINPATGYPSTGLTSVTIFGPNAEFANGLSTSIMVLGENAGKELIKKFPNYRFIMINDKGKIIRSKRLKTGKLPSRI